MRQRLQWMLAGAVLLYPVWPWIIEAAAGRLLAEPLLVKPLSEHLPGYGVLLDALCPDRWIFYTPFESSVVRCHVPAWAASWLGPALSWMEGAILGGLAHVMRMRFGKKEGRT